jgi:hypothetical protein
MKTAKQATRAVAAVVMILVLLGLGTVTAQPGRAGKPDRTKPVPATDITLAKKISIKGGRPAGRGGPKRAEAATGILGADLPAGSGKYAIIVGISDYPGTDSDLNYADDDAVDVGNALQTAYGFTDIVTLTDGDATRANILAAIAGVPSDADELVFFFSGHGMSGRAKDGDAEKVDEAIVAHDGEKLVPIWDGELEGAFADCPATRIVFIFDICLAGGMDDLAGPGRVILMASGERGYSYELSDLENGEFTYYFAERGILGGEANIHDYFGEGTGLTEQVTAEEGFDYAKANCRLDRPTISDGFDDDLLP